MENEEEARIRMRRMKELVEGRGGAECINANRWTVPNVCRIRGYLCPSASGSLAFLLSLVLFLVLGCRAKQTMYCRTKGT